MPLNNRPMARSATPSPNSSGSSQPKDRVLQELVNLLRAGAVQQGPKASLVLQQK